MERKDISNKEERLAQDRKEFLMRMYDEMFNDINRHIMVVWQSVGVVVGAFAVFALAEKDVISMDIAASLVLVLTGWLLAHLHDAAYWYNRNLVIIANIEKEFLGTKDLRRIHYYFGEHRPKNKMITHLRIQYALGVGIGGVIVIYHFFGRVVGGFSAPWANFDPPRTLPYFVLIGIVIYLVHLRKYCERKYLELLRNSSGKNIDTSGIVYGVGHGYKEKAGRVLMWWSRAKRRKKE